MQLKTLYLLHFLLTVFALPQLAGADLLWLEKADSCESFAKGIKEQFGGAKKYSSLDERQKAELKIVLKAACSDRFRACGFVDCSTVKTEPKPDTAATSPAIAKDPLSWLQMELTCEELVGQMKARYEPLGKYSELSGEKKEELKQVLEVACSERFAHCSFKNCLRLRPQPEVVSQPRVAETSAPVPAPIASPVVATTPEVRMLEQTTSPLVAETPTSVPAVSPMDYRDLAQQELLRRIRNLQELQQKMIDERVGEETAAGAEWTKMGNPEELEALKNRRRITRIPAEGDGKEADGVTGGESSQLQFGQRQMIRNGSSYSNTGEVRPSRKPKQDASRNVVQF